MKKWPITGFSLIESLLCLLIFCLIFLACLSFVSTLQNQFMDLKQEFESNETAFFALDRIKMDLDQAGQGLLIPMGLDLLQALKIEGNRMEILSKETDISLMDNLYPGQTRIALESTKALRKNRLICVYNRSQGEISTIFSIDDHSIVLSSPLQNSYSLEESYMLMVREVDIFLDTESHVLRRKVNTSSAQPLVEETKDFVCTYDQESHLTEIQLVLELDEEKNYECSLSPKNLFLLPSL